MHVCFDSKIKDRLYKLSKTSGPVGKGGRWKSGPCLLGFEDTDMLRIIPTFHKNHLNLATLHLPHKKSDASFQQQQKNHVETVQNLLWHMPRGFVYKHCQTNCILTLCLHRYLIASFDNSFSLISLTCFYIFLEQKYCFQAISCPKSFDKFANYF